MAPVFDAVILAGGRARRLGGIDKPALEVGGSPLLRRALDAARAAERIVVVGPTRDLGAPDTEIAWTREDPPDGGPVAALAAGVALVDADVIVVLAADLPMIDAEVVTGLAGKLGDRDRDRDRDRDADGVVAVDEAGRDQYLCAAYRTSVLRAGIDAVPELSGAPMRALVSGLRLVHVPIGARAADIDTPDDLNLFRSQD